MRFNLNCILSSIRKNCIMNKQIRLIYTFGGGFGSEKLVSHGSRKDIVIQSSFILMLKEEG